MLSQILIQLCTKPDKAMLGNDDQEWASKLATNNEQRAKVYVFHNFCHWLYYLYLYLFISDELKSF